MTDLYIAPSDDICRYSYEFEWADRSTALYKGFIMRSNHKKTCGMIIPGMSMMYQQLSCTEPEEMHYLCEMDSSDTKTLSQPITTPVESTNQTLPFPHVRCPRGHLTHTFLACDAKASCFDDNYLSGDDVWLGLASCSVQLHPLPPSFPCASGFERVPYSLVCDHRQDCLDNSDEHFCVFAPCADTTMMQCAASKQVRKCAGNPSGFVCLSARLFVCTGGIITRELISFGLFVRLFVCFLEKEKEYSDNQSHFAGLFACLYR